ncbi:hypothetical protein T11_15397 [Trichinella zimbabwensis]|uniref:Uncharacterized protein n=1 Tax=Trichinella zimbabwensis TaxID=268475 RepID=A0A0V1GS42_9BILA|nr:hypothetical protein T11_15397 [Trichinella zimbabwensis]
MDCPNKGNLFHNYWAVWDETLQNTVIYESESIAIKKSPNFEKKIFAVFRKTTKSIAHEILKFPRKAFFSKIVHNGCQSIGNN